MLPRSCVLVVDPLDETQEVLRAALGDRGIEVVAARDSAQALALARKHRPQLIVLDLECDAAAAALAGRFARASANRPTSLVVLATARRARGELPPCQIVAKPFHYAPLIRQIEGLLQGLLHDARQPAAKAA